MKTRWITGLVLIATPVLAGPAAPPSARTAPIAMLVDLSAGQTLFSRNADVPFLPASMTKAMTALVAFDLIKTGKLNEDARFAVRPRTAARWSGKGTTLALKAGEQVKVSDLLDGVITASANDAAAVLAEGALGSQTAWHAAMNARARALGMESSQFASANGLPDGGKTQVIARDMIRLGQALIVEHPELYSRYFGHRDMVWKGRRLYSRNPLTGYVSGADGIKTGHTREAGYTFLGAAERDGRRLLLVVARTASEADRASAARNLLEWGYDGWETRPFARPGQLLGRIKVQGGDARSVPVSVARPFLLAWPRRTRPQVSARILYDGPVRAPIATGALVGRLEVRMAGQPVHYLPLVTTKAVGPAGPIDRIVNGLLGLLE